MPEETLPLDATRTTVASGSGVKSNEHHWKMFKSVEPIEEQEVEGGGEVGENVRNLTEIEMEEIGKLIGGEWKTLAKKLGFKGDEVVFFFN